MATSDNNEQQPRWQPARVEPRNFITRFRDALTAFKSDRPDFGRSSGYYIDPLTHNWRWAGWGWNRDFGQQIDYKKEVGPLENSSLIAAVLNFTATTIPEAPPTVYTIKTDGEWDALPKHPAAKLIRRPNPFHTWANYAGGLSADWWIAGNVYLEKVRDDAGDLIELWLLPSFMVEPRWPGDGKRPDVPTSGKNKATNNFLSHYQFNVPGREPRLAPASDIVHIKRFINLANPRLGMGTFESIVNEVYGDNKAALFTATILRNMGIVVPILAPKDKDVTITDTQAAAMEETWMQKTTGANIGKPIINTVAIEATKFSFSPQELDLKELRKIPESRIASVTGIPAPVLQFLAGLENGTSYASYEQARKQAYESVIIPIQKDIAEQLSHQLLYEFEDEGDEIGFDTTDVRVLQEDENALAKRELDALRAGATTINQALQAMGKPDLGPAGEIHLVPSLNTPMTLERINEVAKGKPKDGNGNGKPSSSDVIDATTLATMGNLDEWTRKLDAQMDSFISQWQRSRKS